jgi:hypothetical protein
MVIKKSHKRKRGQLKIQQMAFMLIAVVLFFALVGIFVIVVKFSGLKQASIILEEENSMLLVTKLANSPEFACGSSFGNSKLSCIDADKIMVLKKHISSYIGFWGIAEIQIRKIYPDSKIECNLKNYPDCGIINVYSKNVNKLPASSNFVALCWKENSDTGIYDKCEIARLMVSSEDKT